jgi:hypothetical protein
MPFDFAMETLQHWINGNLQNVRFSGGEPTIYPRLSDLVKFCRDNGVKRIAISTNGSAPLDEYKNLVKNGVNDFSISLDGGCCAIGDAMAGVEGCWNTVVDNIREIAKMSYTTVGMVFTESNVGQCVDAVLFADSLGVSDIRVIPAAQYNQALINLASLSDGILAKYPILRYRVNNVRSGCPVRGIGGCDSRRCNLCLDDMAVAGKWHFPCIIYLREGGNPIGKIGPQMRYERANWNSIHDTHADMICRKNCLDVCVAYNNMAERGAK